MRKIMQMGMSLKAKKKLTMAMTPTMMTMRKKLYFDNSKSKWSHIVFISTIIKNFLRCIDNIGAVVTAFL